MPKASSIRGYLVTCINGSFKSVVRIGVASFLPLYESLLWISSHPCPGPLSSESTPPAPLAQQRLNNSDKICYMLGKGHGKQNKIDYNQWLWE